MSAQIENLHLLMEEDQEFIAELGLPVDIHKEGSEVHVVLKEFRLPDEYTPSTVSVLFRLPQGYNVSMIDMFWTDPWVKLKSGLDPQACSVAENYCGKSWQRWSRHYPWRPGVDNLRTFVAAINKELQLKR